MTTTALGDGPDQFVGGDGDDQILGNGGNDTLNGWVGNDSLFGGTGNDLLANSGTGDDVYFGGAGDDQMVAGFGTRGDVVDGGAGNDLIDLDYSGFAGGGISLTWGASFVVVLGGLNGISVTGCERLSFLGSGNDDSITSGDGQDRIDLGGGHDVVLAGGGDDTVRGLQYFTADGGDGVDLLELNLSTTTRGVALQMSAPVTLHLASIAGTAVNFERLYALLGSGRDTVTGGDYADSLYGGGGADRLFGGEGNDAISASDARAAVFGGGGDDAVSAGGGIAGQAGAVIDGGSGNDVLRGNLSDDRLYGGSGNDVLSGQGGSDSLFGGDGNDQISGTFGGTVACGAGDDVLNTTLDATPEVISGGAGIDSLQLAVTPGQAAQVTATARGFDLSLGGTLVQTALGFERLSFTGGSLADSVDGGSLNDVLYGAFVNAGVKDADTLNGFGGDDYLQGADGADLMTGGTGNDQLNGGLGADTLRGGTGVDRFIFGTTSDSNQTGRDIIQGFQRGIDKIDLSRIDADTTDFAVEAFGFRGRLPATGMAGELRFEFVGQKTLVQGFVNDDLIADFELQLKGRFVLEAGDFVL